LSIINEPTDLLSLALKNLLTPLLTDDKIQNKIKNWKRVIVLELSGLYGITLTFNNGNISIEYGEKPKYDLKLVVSLDAFTGIAEGKVGLISAFVKRKIKVKKIYRIFTVLKFYKIFFPAIKGASENPVIEGIYNLL